MHHLLVLLAVLSLVARWADAPCGCAEHNGWAALAAGDGSHGHDHGEEPAVSHDCGGIGRPAFAGAAPVQATGTAASMCAVLADVPAVFAAADPGDLSPFGTPPLRAALNVYRV